MNYPKHTYEILVGMGFAPEDFSVITTGPTTTNIAEWFSAQPKPTEGEVAAAFTANPNAFAERLIANDRATLIAWLSNGPLPAKLMRALMLILLDELNLHAAKLNAILTAIDNGGTLAQVKTNIAAIADYPQRTKAQLITSLTNKINAGDADA